jgi:hypothetical protein
VTADDRYVVAVRRNRRDDAPDDWLGRVSALGASIVGEFGVRAQITASPAVVTRLRDELGDLLLIEPLNEHHTASG